MLLSSKLATEFQETTNLCDDELTHMRFLVVGLPYVHDGIYIKEGTGILQIQLVFEDEDIHSGFAVRQL